LLCVNSSPKLCQPGNASGYNIIYFHFCTSESAKKYYWRMRMAVTKNTDTRQLSRLQFDIVRLLSQNKTIYFR